MDQAELRTQLMEAAAEVDGTLGQWALLSGAHVENLHDGVRYALGLDDENYRGKRVRPALAVLTCEALGGSRRLAMPFAAAVEMMHNFFLAHDDIEDGDETRHGRPAVWRRYGLAHAINIGDYLHARTMAVVLMSIEEGVSHEKTIRLLSLLSDTLDHTVRGQARDITARGSARLTVDDYMKIVREKTGFYLAAPILGGAILAGADEPVIAAIRKFGDAVGPMYQIMDDLIDLTEDKGRGECGADVREGKRSFMVAHALANLDEPSRKELCDILDRPREETTPADVDRAIALFESCGAMDAARETIDGLGRHAREATAEMPDRLRDLLLAFTEYLESRKR